MKILSAVLEISGEVRRTGRNVEYKKQIIVNFDYESSENSYKKNLYCCFDLLAYINVASKVLRPMPTILMHSTSTSFKKLYLQPHYTYSNFIEVATSTAHSLSRFQPSDFEPNMYIYRVSQEECARPRESVPYVKVYRYNPKHLYPKLNGYGDNGQRSLKL